MAINLIVTKDTPMVDILSQLEKHIADQFANADTLVIEVKSKSDKAVGGSIKPLVEERIKRGLSNAQILKEVLELQPEAKTSKASVAWYRSQLTKRLYKPLVKSLRVESQTKDLEDKEIVALLQKNGIDTLEAAKDFFENYDFDEKVEITEEEDEAETGDKNTEA